MEFLFVSILSLCTVISQVFGSGYESPWGYTGEIGPIYWEEHYPICNDKKQSPIDLTEDMEHVTDAFQWENYDAMPDKMWMENNGHTVKLQMSTRKPAVISKGGLEAAYEFLQLHFHWGANKSRGSEHTVEGKRFPMEMHIVHWNKKYGSPSKALKHEDGLAVLGVFFKVTSTDNENYKQIVDAITRIRPAERTINITSVFALKSLLPEETDEFFRYQGSLTTPSCNEIVTWTLLDSPVEISENQLDQFRTTMDDNSRQLVDNFRPVQSRNGRKVVKYTSGARSAHYSLGLVLMAVYMVGLLGA